MSCWDNVIGIRGLCEAQTPSSGLYINDLTGISIKDLNAGVNEEDATAFTLIQRKVDQAATMMQAEALSYLYNRWNYTTSAWDGVVGYFPESLRSLAAAPVYRGIGMRYRQADYISVSVNAVTLLLPVSTTVNVLVVDLITGTTLDTIPITTIANTPVRVVANKKYTSNGQMLNLAFVYNATSIASFQTGLYPTYSCGGCGRAQRWYENMLERTIEIPTGGSILEQNINGGSWTGGLSVDYQVACSFESLLCAHIGQLGYPVLYKAGMLILKELEFSKRLNGIVVFNRERNQELATYYQEQYDNYMQRYFDAAQLPNTGCFACKQRVRQVSRIP
jgi:hypothetical protein